MKSKLLSGLCLLTVFTLASCNNGFKFDTSKSITLYTRDTDSGTRDGFFTKIGLSEAATKNDALSKSIVTVTSNGDMIEKVKGDEYGIGYISLSSLSTSNVKGLKYEGVEPTEENVLSSTYALTRNFNYVVRNDYASDDKKGQIVEAYLAYLTTEEATSTIQAESGICELSTITWDSIKDNYPICSEDNSSITIKFGGSTSAEKIAKKLSEEFAAKCGNFVPEHNHTGSGDAYKFTQGASKDDDGKLDVGFLSRELKSEETCAEGTYGKLCIDAIVAVVNQENPLEEVTASDLVKMFDGTAKAWSEFIK